MLKGAARALAASVATETNCHHLASNFEMTTVTVRVAFVVALVGSMAAQGVDVPADTVMRLQRTSCLGPCPIYVVTIDARGMVTYDGDRFVRVVVAKRRRFLSPPSRHCWPAPSAFVSSRCVTPIVRLRIPTAQ